MVPYEISYIVNPSLDEETVNSLVERFSSVITSKGGELVKVDKAGKRKLAYEIKGQKEGYYVFTQFRAPKETASELARQVKLADEVLRSLLIRTN